MSIIIKKMTSDEEIRQKAYVHYKSWHDTYPGLVDKSYLDSLSLDKCIELAYKWPDNIIIAKDGAKVIGFAAYGKYRSEDKYNTGEVYAIYLLKEYIGKGIGRRLMDTAVGFLDYPEIAVWVLKGNEHATRFYYSYGYRFDGEEKTIKLGTEATELRMIF